MGGFRKLRAGWGLLSHISTVDWLIRLVITTVPTGVLAAAMAALGWLPWQITAAMLFAVFVLSVALADIAFRWRGHPKRDATASDTDRRRDDLETFARMHFDDAFEKAHAVLLRQVRYWLGSDPKTQRDLVREWDERMRLPPSAAIAATSSVGDAEAKLIEELHLYRECVSEIHEIPKLWWGKLPKKPEGYDDWRVLDAAFVTELHQFVVRPGYALLHAAKLRDWGLEERSANWRAPVRDTN